MAAMVGILAYMAIPQFHGLPERAYCSGLPVGEVAKWAVRRDVDLKTLAIEI
jgi:hypothetical protein